MNFTEFLSEVKKLNLREIRKDQPDYLEGVLAVSLLPRLVSILESHFGPATKPPGPPPKEKDRKIASPYGGVEKNQTLYAADRGGENELALLWPWGDGASVTVKIARRPVDAGI